MECTSSATPSRSVGARWAYGRASVARTVIQSLSTISLANLPRRGYPCLRLTGQQPAKSYRRGATASSARDPDVAGLKGEGVAWPVCFE
jgi:hypothetical protein